MASQPKGLLSLALVIVAAGTFLPSLIPTPKEAPQRRDVEVVARKYAYDPPILTVNQGDEVHVRFASKDVIHGFYLEGYDLDALADPGKSGFRWRHPSQSLDYAPTEEIVFKADKEGKFRYRCSMTCGYMHPFMMGVLIVRPNSLFSTASGMMVGILLAGCLLAWPKQAPPASKTEGEPA
jgi:heme/copper-type cytochrome/quinol oxidase subunit 2